MHWPLILKQYDKNIVVYLLIHLTLWSLLYRRISLRRAELLLDLEYSFSALFSTSFEVLIWNFVYGFVIMCHRPSLFFPGISSNFESVMPLFGLRIIVLSWRSYSVAFAVLLLDLEYVIFSLSGLLLLYHWRYWYQTWYTWSPAHDIVCAKKGDNSVPIFQSYAPF